MAAPASAEQIRSDWDRGRGHQNGENPDRQRELPADGAPKCRGIIGDREHRTSYTEENYTEEKVTKELPETKTSGVNECHPPAFASHRPAFASYREAIVQKHPPKPAAGRRPDVLLIVASPRRRRRRARRLSR
jgi:hypothetical protein